MIKIIKRLLIAVITIMFTSVLATSQTTMPDVLLKGTLDEQLKYLDEKTRIYENYRAIREDMFQLVKKNASDSLSGAMSRIDGYILQSGKMNFRIDSLNNLLSSARENLNEAVRTKNSIKVLGINLNKHAYNTVMLLIAGVLGFLLITGFLSFRRNLTVTSNLKKELEDLRAEFEEYKKKARLEREKMSKDHFNEIRRLKGK